MQSLLPLSCLLACVVSQLLVASAGLAQRTNEPETDRAHWPQTVVVTVGDARTRIEGAKLWTLSGIDYQDAIVATEDSAYGTVLTIRDVGHLGTAHFLDVPGKPGEIETENVHHLRFFVDDKPVDEWSPRMDLRGDSFRMERRSTIRNLDLETIVLLRDGVLTETARFQATGPIDLEVAYPWMYAWTEKATEFVFGDENGIQQRGEFLKEGEVVSRVVRNANWMAVFDPSENTGSVCCFMKHPPNAEPMFLLVDAPGAYRKVAAYALVDQVVPDGYDGTYQSVVGFFTAGKSDWEEQARRRAMELQTAQ
jgi:hypothetical protein